MEFIHNVVPVWPPIGHAQALFKEMSLLIQTFLPYKTAPQDMQRGIALRLT